jgi:DNA-binding NarL/FixJ family response regulator
MSENNQHILILEDNEIIRRGLEDLLLSTNLFEKIYCFANGEEAIAKADTLSPPAIMLIDIGLPGISGIETMKKLLQKWPIARALIITIFDDSDHLYEALKYGASGYVLKNESPDYIIKSVKEMLSGGAPMSKEIACKILDYFKNKNPEVNDELVNLTTREYEILKLLSNGYLNKEIASNLNLSTNTIKNHLQNIYYKLHVQNRSEAIIKFMNNK